MPENQIAISDLTFTVIAGTISFIVITIAIIAILVAFQRKRIGTLKKIQDMEISFEKQLFKSRVEVQEETSSLLAKELHDNIGQLLTGTKILMGLAERQIEAQVNMPDTFLQAQQSLEKAIQELRTLSKVLDKDWISHFSFIENLQQQAQRINDTGMACCKLLLPAAVLTMSPDKQIILFRIVQEGIQNAMKHGGADAIDINIFNENNQFEIHVSDNGRGWDTSAPHGMGITNMQHRTEILGGRLSIESVPNNGTNLTITIPLS